MTINPAQGNRIRTGILVNCLLLLAIAPTASLATNASYYSDRLAAGKFSLSNGNFQEAVVDLRLACFASTNEAKPLAECKSFLFLALLGTRDKAAARDTLNQLAALEQSSGAFSQATLPPEIRSQIESEAVLSFSDLTFPLSPRFAEIVERARTQIETTPARADEDLSLSELRGLSESNPTDSNLKNKLAVRLYEEEKIIDALRLAEELVSLEPENQDARCIQATISSARNRSTCSVFLDQMERCPRTLWTQFHYQTRLRCYSDEEAWNRGRDFIVSLPEGQFQRGSTRKLARKISKNAAPLTEPGTTTSNGSALTEPQVSAEDSSAIEPTAPTASSPRASSQTSSEPPPASVPSARPKTPTAAESAIARRAAAIRGKGLAALRATDPEQLAEALQEGMVLAQQNPSNFSAQQVTGELAYLASQWATVVESLTAARGIEELGAKSLFYLAVGYYETGETTAAASTMQKSLDSGLIRNRTVDRYQEKILGSRR